CKSCTPRRVSSRVISLLTAEALMQMRVLQQAGAAGANLASSLNISAFNLGNALGAWVGGLVLSHGFGLLALGGAAAEPEI
ncbi:MAG TPA: hypothetical protein PKV30_12405, partial [Ottowia sp.]|nr:hypothetical protein [Ottowia sp.]